MFGVIDPLSPEDKIDGIPVQHRSKDRRFAFISVCSLLDHLSPGWLDGGWDPEDLDVWAAQNEATWYTYLDHQFDAREAIRKAEAEGNTVIIYEDLS